MCGLYYAFTTNNTPIGNTAFGLSKLLAESQVARGLDAWGLAWLTTKGKIRSRKFLGAANTPVAQEFITGVERVAVAIIGHTRFATHGSKDDVINAHPHVVGKEGFLCHNGMIGNYKSLQVAHSIVPISACDSEILATMVGKFGMSEAVKQVNDWESLACLVLRKNKTIEIVRRGNPMYTASRKGTNGTVHYGASTPTSIKFAGKGKYVEMKTRADCKTTLVCLKTGRVLRTEILKTQTSYYRAGGYCDGWGGQYENEGFKPWPYKTYTPPTVPLSKDNWWNQPGPWETEEREKIEARKKQAMWDGEDIVKGQEWDNLWKDKKKQEENERSIKQLEIDIMNNEIKSDDEAYWRGYGRNCSG